MFGLQDGGLLVDREVELETARVVIGVPFKDLVSKVQICVYTPFLETMSGVFRTLQPWRVSHLFNSSLQDAIALGCIFSVVQERSPNERYDVSVSLFPL